MNAKTRPAGPCDQAHAEALWGFAKMTIPLDDPAPEARPAPMTALLPFTLLAPPVWRAANALRLAAALLLASRLALAIEATPDDPIASTQVPNVVTEITQQREQNAVTSVRVKRGDNVYHITPSEQVSASDSGGRAATWEIFQFNASPAPSRSKPQATPPALR